MTGTWFGNGLWLAIATSIALFPLVAPAEYRKPIDPEKARVIDQWTYARRSNAVPRELVVDPRGLGYLRRPDGSFQPHGHEIPAKVAPGNRAILPFGTPADRPTDTDPVDSGSTKTRLRQAPAARTLSATHSDPVGSSGGRIAASEFAYHRSLQKATGRLFFEMPADAKRTEWRSFVCSGTIATMAPKSVDGTERSVIITAAHCIYDDVNKVFARNVMFIPAQAGARKSGTDFSCSTDATGCWVPSFGVVNENWTTGVFPENIEWDYGFYVIPDSGAHEGAGSDSILDRAAGSLPVSFRPMTHRDRRDTPYETEITYALGYSHTGNSPLTYCAEGLTTEDDVNWWLPDCELAGGSAGGPWVRPTKSARNPIVSVSSWGRTSNPGIAGPRLDSASAYCVFSRAMNQPAPATTTGGEAGFAARCP